jgi:hypothetical protein
MSATKVNTPLKPNFGAINGTQVYPDVYFWAPEIGAASWGFQTRTRDFYSAGGAHQSPTTGAVENPAKWHKIAAVHFSHDPRESFAKFRFQHHTSHVDKRKSTNSTMDSSKAPVKLVKVTRVLGRTGTKTTHPSLSLNPDILAAVLNLHFRLLAAQCMRFG